MGSAVQLFGVPLPSSPPRAALPTGDAGPHECGIPLRDGIELAADVHLPAATPAAAVVLGTPYDKSDARHYRREARTYTDAGYAAVVYDVRGRGKSEGEWRAFVHDADDGHDVVEWVAAQDWCTGAVGVTGLSYPGWVAWATASTRPPHLRAMVSTSAAGRWMQEIPYTYGCFQLYFAYWAAAVRRRIVERGGLDLARLVEIVPVQDIGDAIAPSGRTWDDLMEHDTLDEFWSALRWDGAYDRFDVPCLHVTGWHDLEDLHGAFHHYEQAIAGSSAADRQWLVVGPWSHLSCRLPAAEYGGVSYGREAALDMDALHLRFFDRFLRDAGNGLDADPRVRLFDTGAHRWAAPAGWGAGTSERALFLAGGGALAAEAGPAGSRPMRYDPGDAPGVRFDVRTTPWEPPLDMAGLEAHPDVLTWTTPPLEEPVTLHGWSELLLHAASDVEDTEWHVKLTDVDPDGRSLRVAWGCLRASHRESLSRPVPIEPGVVTAYPIELSPAFHTFAAGHRIRVSLAGSDFPWFARHMNHPGPIRSQAEPRVATHAVSCGGDHASVLRLRMER